MQGLNDAQRQAVSHFEGPMLVLAGPGSGKTRVITERVRYLIEEKHVVPASILVITFTKAAAVQMRERYLALSSPTENCCNRSGAPAGERADVPPSSPQRSGVHFGTFHAIFFMILKRAYHYTADNIVRDDVRYDLLKRILGETELEIQDEQEFLGDLQSEISRVKGERIDLANYYSPLCSNEIFQEIYGKYQRALEQRRLIDFDDMLVYCYELLEQRPDIRKMWQQQFRYILIDEFQDISRIQYDVVKLLGEPANNIFIVGDDDQSIYGFRGARPDIMKQFLKDYPHAGKCLLGVNYRCAPEIVKAAGKVIGKNKNRLPKEIRSGREMVSDGSTHVEVNGGLSPAPQRGNGNCQTNHVLEVREFPQVSEQNEAVREKLLAYRNQGIPYHEMAVLFRTNTQARSLSTKLMEFNIPFTMKEHLPNLYDHWVVRDVLTYVRIAGGNREREQVLRIINRPKRYVHRNAFTEPYVDWEELKCFYEEKDWMVDRIEQLQYDLSMLAKMKPYAAVNFIRRGIGYDEYIKEYAEYRGMRADDLFEILDELLDEAREQETFEQWFDHMQKYREELREQAKKSSLLQQGGQQEDSVMLMTMHGAKGLEFECVFIPDANEGVTPHSKSVLNADMEEERRMFYVAMTRAKSHLHIYYLKERFNKEVEVSRFVEEVTE